MIDNKGRKKGDISSSSIHVLQKSNNIKNDELTYE